MMLLRPYTHWSHMLLRPYMLLRPSKTNPTMCTHAAYTTEEGIKWEKVKEMERVRVREEEREIER